MKAAATSIGVLAVTISLLLSSACAPVRLNRIETGKLATEGARIEATDGSFTIRSGEIFQAPYQNAQFTGDPNQSPDSYDAVDPQSHNQLPIDSSYKGAAEDVEDKQSIVAGRQYIFQNRSSLVTQSGAALQAGAKPVKIHLPTLQRPLHGILFLGMGLADSPDLSSKSYLISLPDKYVRKALNGRISVVYESQSTSLPIRSVPTWILWMSDQKFF